MRSDPEGTRAAPEGGVDLLGPFGEASNMLKRLGSRIPKDLLAVRNDKRFFETCFARASQLREGGRIDDSNDILRDVPALGATRAEQVTLTRKASQRDSGFTALIAQADGARDSGHWAVAETKYAQALAFYPLHGGYSVQMAHMLKEQGRFADAEAFYRTGVALGEPTDQVIEHLAFVCARQDVPMAAPGYRPHAAGLECTPTVFEVGTLAWLLWHTGHVPARERAALFRSCRSCAEVVIAMIQDTRFVTRNRQLLEMWGATR